VHRVGYYTHVFTYYLLNANVDVLRIHNSSVVKRDIPCDVRSGECELCFVYGRTMVQISTRKLPITAKVLRIIHHSTQKNLRTVYQRRPLLHGYTS
jgi:hypothetical protein